MTEPLLSEEELSALRGATRTTSASRRTSSPRIPTPVALIAEHRAGESARPASLRIAARWASLVRARLTHALSVKLAVEVAGSETLHGPLLKDELATAWTSVVEVEDRPGLVAVSISGRMIEWTAAQLLGCSPDDANVDASDRPPSRTALGVFARVGEVVTKALADSWREEQNAAVKPVTDPERIADLRFQLLEPEPLVVVTLEIGEPTQGRVRLIAQPETLVAPAPPMKIAPLSRERFEAAVAAVPVEVRVELGRARLRMAELKALRPGSLITLHQPTDALLPVSCGGIVKAHGRPAVSRGVMAIEIVSNKGSENT